MNNFLVRLTIPDLVDPQQTLYGDLFTLVSFSHENKQAIYVPHEDLTIGELYWYMREIIDADVQVELMYDSNVVVDSISLRLTSGIFEYAPSLICDGFLGILSSLVGIVSSGVCVAIYEPHYGTTIKQFHACIGKLLGDGIKVEIPLDTNDVYKCAGVEPDPADFKGDSL